MESVHLELREPAKRSRKLECTIVLTTGDIGLQELTLALIQRQFRPNACGVTVMSIEHKKTGVFIYCKLHPVEIEKTPGQFGRCIIRNWVAGFNARDQLLDTFPMETED